MQDSEPKMTNDVKDSLMNIRRQDEAMVTKEKNIDLFITHTNGPNRIVSSNIIPNPINNLSNISSIYEVDYVDSKMKTIECYEKIENSKASDVHSHTSDLKSFSGDVKNYLNFFSLPMYGLCEKSTQTELSGRDIDDLDYFRKELCASSQGLLKNNNKDKTEFIKRLFPFLDDKKISYSLTLANKNPLQEEVPNTNFEKNFIQIKRKGEGSEKTPRNKTSLGNSTPILDLHNHIHIKNKKQNQNVAKRKKKEEIITELTQSSKSDETLSLHRTNPKTKSGETTPFKLISKKKSINILNLINEVVDDVKYSNNQKGQPNLSYSEPLNGSSDINQHKKDFNDSEFNISEIINDIKKSTRKEITPFDSQILLKKVKI